MVDFVAIELERRRFRQKWLNIGWALVMFVFVSMLIYGVFLILSE
jgi:hypothetical protein